jgi:hypothetical protein
MPACEVHAAASALYDSASAPTPTPDTSASSAPSYAPYLIPRWAKWDRSTRQTLYYTLSVFDDSEAKLQYQPQLLRSDINCCRGLCDPKL